MVSILFGIVTVFKLPQSLNALWPIPFMATPSTDSGISNILKFLSVIPVKILLEIIYRHSYSAVNEVISSYSQTPLFGIVDVFELFINQDLNV